MIIQERLYLTADKKLVVKEGDKRAAFLFSAKGRKISDKLAERYGIEDGTVKTKIEKEVIVDRPEIKPRGIAGEKAVEKPENKMAKAKNKGGK